MSTDPDAGLASGAKSRDGLSLAGRPRLRPARTALDALVAECLAGALPLAAAGEHLAGVPHAPSPASGDVPGSRPGPAASLGEAAATQPYAASGGNAASCRPAVAAGSALFVLVVDDIAMNRNLAAAFLESAGHLAMVAANGLDGVSMAASHDYDVVLMDVRMPGVDGLEAARRIRALGGARGGVPIVAMTALVFQRQVDACQAAGMHAHIAKPFTPRALLDAVAAAVASGPISPGVQSSVFRDPVLDDALIIDVPAFQHTCAHLTPSMVRGEMHALGRLSEKMLRAMRDPAPGFPAAFEAVDCAHAIAGSASLFGFARLAVACLRFERSFRSDPADAPALAELAAACLKDALGAMRAHVPAGARDIGGILS